MLSEEKKKHLINEILSSKTFRKATTSSALLRYLLEADIKGSYLKEGIIDIDFFGGKGDAEKNNNRVRVSIYNLRKMLKNYHEVEGVNSPWIVGLEKGHYGLTFSKRISVKPWMKPSTAWRILPYFLLLSLIVFVLIKVRPDYKSKIWRNFLKNGHVSTLYIGDVFGLHGKTITGLNGWTRSYNINNAEDYYELINYRPDLKKVLRPANYSYITGMGAVASRNIAQLYANYHKTFDIRFSSNTSYDDIKSGNAIYVGPMFNKNKFISLLNNANPYVNLGDQSFYVSQHPEIPDTVIHFAGRDTWEYTFVSKIPGSDGTEQLVFFSDHDIGVKASIEFFTNTDSLKQFEKKHLKDNDYFTAVFMAFGRERTNLGLKELVVVPF